MRNQRLRSLLVWLLLALLLAACLQLPPDTTTPPATMTNLLKTPTQSSVPSHTPSRTDTPRPVPSSTPVQPIFTSTPTRTPPPTTTPAVTPYPTLAPDAMQAFIIERMSDNGGCELPCWWGVTPGKTSWETIQQSFESAGIQVMDDSLGLKYRREDTFGNTHIDHMMQVGFTHEDAFVEGIYITNNLSFTPFLETYRS